ncbi:MAG: FAD-dependent oxidoreductase [Bacillota bacterium]|nr:FAD-dependent oxidoreductase [Bacillota bacterium]
MPSKSLWLEERVQKFNPLRGEQAADVAVVGGGITGLTTAYLLTRAGMNVALVEAREVSSGASGHTTAHITSQHDLVYARWIKRFGMETASLYAKANESAISTIEGIIAEERIECDFTEVDSYAYTNDHARFTDILDEAQAASELGISAELKKDGDFILPYLMAVRFRNQAMFHPVKYLNGLAGAIVRGGGRIFEQSRVLHIREGQLETAEGVLRASKIIIATHLPVVNFPGWYFARVYQSRSYVLALSKAPQIDGMWDCIDKNGKTYRMYKDYLIVCGGGHKCGVQSKSSRYAELKSFCLRRIPGIRVEYSWSAQDGITIDGLPYIGQYSKKTPWLFVATGYAKWGMTQGTVAGSILASLIKKDENPYIDVFSPQRRMGLTAVSGLVSQNAATLAHLTTGFLRFGPPLCAHMKCRLVWNKDEHTWDCPCHGSRFDESGAVLEPPAIHGLKR